MIAVFVVVEFPEEEVAPLLLVEVKELVRGRAGGEGAGAWGCGGAVGGEARGDARESRAPTAGSSP